MTVNNPNVDENILDNPNPGNQVDDKGADPGNQNQNPDSGNQNPQDKKTIPYDRFQQKVQEVNAFTNTLKELGFDDLEALKSFTHTAKDLTNKEDERKRQEMSEIEKLQEDLKKASTTIETLNNQIQESNTNSKKDKIVREFEKLATSKGVSYLDDALHLANLNFNELTVNGEGKVEGLESIIDGLVSSKPFLLKEKVKQPEQIGGSTNPPKQDDDGKTKQEVLKGFADRARQTGRHEDMVAYMQKKKELGL